MNTTLNQYQREAILSASPARLLTMLYDRLMLDLSRAETAQHTAQWDEASTQLLHAQAIITELTSSLKPEVWSGADQLQGLYSFVTQLLIRANTEHDAGLTAQATALLEPLRQAWHEAAASPEASAAPSATAGQARAALPGTAAAAGTVAGSGAGSGSLLGVG